MDTTVRDRAMQEVRDHLAPLRTYIEDPGVTELMVNRPDCVFVEQGGTMKKVDVRLSDVEVKRLITILGKLVGKDVRPGTPDGIIDSRFDGLRVAAALAPTAYNGHCICLRRHSNSVFPLDSYVNTGRFDPADPPGTALAEDMPPPDFSDVAKGGEALASMFEWMVKSRQNFLVAGSTGSGKTALLNSLIAMMEDDSRVLTIEDTHELMVNLPNAVVFESNEQAGVTSRMLVKLALRMRPDRILMGEVRGPESFDLMRAVNSGHKGSFATLHANSAAEAPMALEKMILTSGIDWPLSSIRADIASAFPYIVFAERRAKRSGVVSEVVRLDGVDSATGRYLVTPIFQRKSSHEPVIHLVPNGRPVARSESVSTEAVA